MANLINNFVLFDYILKRLKMTYKYFGFLYVRSGVLPRLTNLKVNNRINIQQLKNKSLDYKSVAKINQSTLNPDSLENVYNKFFKYSICSTETQKNFSKYSFNIAKSEHYNNQKQISIQQRNNTLSDSSNGENDEVLSINEKEFCNKLLSTNGSAEEGNLNQQILAYFLKTLTKDGTTNKYKNTKVSELLNGYLLCQSSNTVNSANYTQSKTSESTMKKTDSNHKKDFGNPQKNKHPLLFDEFLRSFLLVENINEDTELLTSHKISDSEGSKNIQNLKLSPELKDDLDQLLSEGFEFNFQQNLTKDGTFSTSVCTICKKKGHLKHYCPSPLPLIKYLPPKNKDFTDALGVICTDVFNEYNPSDEKIKERNDVLNELIHFVKDNFHKNANLQLFGSSNNGFNFANSDLDICLTFSDDSNKEYKSDAQIIASLAEKLKNHKGLHNVTSITGAYIPIVRFTHLKSNTECDICANNFLALHNTQLLKAYSEIDIRVKILVYAMKHFAKKCEISNSGEGSLSSYAYTLMVIYFLQQRNPPVIPVLQELYDKTRPRPTRLVKKWNTWFCEDIRNLKKVWPYYGRNKESVGELWLGLLQYYAAEFDFKNYTVSIRQLKPLPRSEKLWLPPRNLAVEDPFDLNHNLGCRLNHQMTTFIMRMFIEGRNAFHDPPAHLKNTKVLEPNNYLRLNNKGTVA